MSDSYAVGSTVVVVVVFSLLFIISFIELVCELSNVESLSYRVEKWAHDKRWFATLFVFFWAVLLAHFFLNPLGSPGT